MSMDEEFLDYVKLQPNETHDFTAHGTTNGVGSLVLDLDVCPPGYVWEVIRLMGTPENPAVPVKGHMIVYVTNGANDTIPPYTSAPSPLSFVDWGGGAWRDASGNPLIGTLPDRAYWASGSILLRPGQLVHVRFVGCPPNTNMFTAGQALVYREREYFSGRYRGGE